MLGKLYGRLKRDGVAACEAFIRKHDALDTAAFEMLTNRWYLGAPNKPKALNCMIELLLASNRRAALPLADRDTCEPLPESP